MDASRLMSIGSMVLALWSGGIAVAQEPRMPYVRIAELEIDPAQLDAYKASVKEEMEASVRVEPGVLAIYAVAENPGLIDTQVARDVVSGSEEAYGEIAKGVPIGRAGRPEEIASAVLWLCSPGASYVVGHALTIDGGMTVV